MPTKPTFSMRVKGSEKTVDVKYDRLAYMRGDRTYLFALHREFAGVNAPRAAREWIVSDPVSGYRLLRVRATYKGMPISSRSMTLAEARQCALADIDALADRIGIVNFEAVIDRAHASAQTVGA